MIKVEQIRDKQGVLRWAITDDGLVCDFFLTKKDAIQELPNHQTEPHSFIVEVMIPLSMHEQEARQKLNQALSVCELTAEVIN